MVGFILRALIAAAGLWIASQIVPGIRAESWRTLIVAGLLLGVVNAIVRPILILFTIITLGLFLFVINGLMLMLVAFFLHDFHVHGLIPAIFGAIVVGLTSWVGSAFIGPRGRQETARR
jgi:putative membrane protein